ncbi:hypothetical protein MJM59_32420, partial [Salmonella enterica subsp. enterica serovar Montevideo]|nr:hypothetical protein [Salmonella enterica subsp. enterica serovar Montevideo]
MDLYANGSCASGGGRGGGPVQERFFAHQCQTYNDVPLPAPDTYYQQRILPVLLDSFDRNS